MDKSLDGRVGPANTSMDARAPSGGKAKGASAEHMSPPVMHLEAHHIKKLFKGKMPPIGSKIKVHGLVHVGAYSEGQDSPPSGGKIGSAGQDNPGRSMTLHFHKMDVDQDNQGSEHTVDQEAERAKGAKAEMDKALDREIGGRKGKKGRDSEGNEEGAAANASVPRGGQD